MNDIQIAQTILSQLGGQRFQLFTGAKSLAVIEKGLQFNLPKIRNYVKNGITQVRITLEPSDTYRIVFGKIHQHEFNKIEEISGLFADQLQEFFTEHTGLDTKF
ncbi:hypothetical protein [Shewanella algae]|uniref:hypothetical protein n=1 Tax=Shewanella algae TaxID=38313 RepID=UPI0031F550C9